MFQKKATRSFLPKRRLGTNRSIPSNSSRAILFIHRLRITPPRIILRARIYLHRRYDRLHFQRSFHSASRQISAKRSSGGEKEKEEKTRTTRICQRFYAGIDIFFVSLSSIDSGSTRNFRRNCVHRVIPTEGERKEIWRGKKKEEREKKERGRR